MLVLRKGRKAAWLTAASAMGLLFASGGAFAQTPPTVPVGLATKTSTQDDTATVDDIIVTATRQSRRLEEVPAAITAVGAEQLSRSGITKLMDIAQVTPGLQMQKNGYTTQPSIRGVSSLTTGYGFENNNAVYIDGFYQPDSVAINGDLVNIAQVEVLKGPQGTLYGRNATGGAILINTLEPTSVLSGRFLASYSRFNERSLQAYVAGPLADGVSFSIAGSTRRSDGYIRDLGVDGLGTDGYDAVPTINDSLRLKLRMQPSDIVTLTFGYNYAKVLDAVGLSYTIYAHPSPALPTPPLRATEPDTVTNNARPDNTAALNEATLRTEIGTAVGRLTLRTSYGARDTRVANDFDASRAEIVYTVIPAEQRTFQQSADWNVDLSPNLDLIVGAQYFNDAIHITGQQAFSGGVLRSTDYTTLKAQAFAAYVDATYAFGRLSATAGLRYSTEDKSVAYYQIAASPVPPADKTATFTGTTPRFVLRYELADRTNVYASYSRGFRSGVFQNQVAANPDLVKPIQPEEITAYEVGFKTARPGFRFDTAAFFYDYSQLHIGVVIPNPVTGLPLSTILNAKAAELYGAEAQVTWSPIENLNVIAGLSLIHARYTDFANATGTGYNAATGLNVANQPQDWSGQQMGRAPSSSATLQVDYGFDFGGGRVGLALNGSYLASHVVNNPVLYGPLAGPGLANKQRYRQPAYGLLNGQASWTSPGSLSLTVFGNNLFNERYLLVTSGGAFGDYRQFSQPRSFGVRVGYSF